MLGEVKSLKEILADEIFKLISNFENVTGAEINTIRLERFETSEIHDKVNKTTPYKIVFEMG